MERWAAFLGDGQLSWSQEYDTFCRCDKTPAVGPRPHDIYFCRYGKEVVQPSCVGLPTYPGLLLSARGRRTGVGIGRRRSTVIQ